MSSFVNNCKNMLFSAGYSKEYFSDNYPVQIDGNTAIVFDSIAFSDSSTQDVSTSCISIKTVGFDDEKRTLEAAKLAATPITILEKGGKYQLWNIKPGDSNCLLEGDESVIQLYFEKNRLAFYPESVQRAKYEDHQITLFEAYGLIDVSHSATKRILSDEFLKGLDAAKNYLNATSNISKKDLSNVTSIVMHIISALIISSKIVDNENSVTNIHSLISTLSVKYNSYFKREVLYRYGKGLIDNIYNALNHTINYRSVDHELLGCFYESSLFQTDEKRADEIRKEFGIYYTPRYLADMISNAIPIEFVKESERRVFDGSCGSGTLLISALKRLESVLPADMDKKDKHYYLTKHLLGNDSDVFATEVSRLSLLLFSIPYGNSWNVTTNDFLYKSIANDPCIIIGNPPFEESRRGEKFQKAAYFLLKYIKVLRNEGFIGIVMPETFLQNKSCSEVRKALLDSFDLLEIWNMPGGIFNNNAATIVIIAKKSVVKGELTQIRTLVRNNNHIKAFRKTHRWSVEYCVNYADEWRNSSDKRISYSFVKSIVDKMNSLSSAISDFCDVFQGVKITRRYLEIGNEKKVSYILNGINFQPYDTSKLKVVNIDYDMLCQIEKSKENGKDTGLRMRHDKLDILKSKNKIIIKKNSTPGTLGSISAAVEKRGYYPSDSFNIVQVKSNSDIDSEILCAWLNSSLVKSYCRTVRPNRTIDIETIKSIPVPEFDSITTKRIREILNGDFASRPSTTSLKKIDKIFEKVIGLNENECIELDEYFKIYDEGMYHSHDTVLSGNTYIYGTVLDTDKHSKTVTVYINELEKEITIPIDGYMPGWLLRKGVDFCALNTGKKMINYQPLRGAALTDEEIVEQLYNMITGY